MLTASPIASSPAAEPDVSADPFSHVHCQGLSAQRSARRSAEHCVVRPCAGSEAGLKTTVDQTLMRGLVTARPRYPSRSFLCQRAGVGTMAGHKKGPRVLLTGPAPDTAHRRDVKVLPSFPVRSLVQAACATGCSPGSSTRRLTAQMKPTSSRATAVMTTFFGLPVAASRR